MGTEGMLEEVNRSQTNDFTGTTHTEEKSLHEFE